MRWCERGDGGGNVKLGDNFVLLGDYICKLFEVFDLLSGNFNSIQKKCSIFVVLFFVYLRLFVVVFVSCHLLVV